MALAFAPSGQVHGTAISNLLPSPSLPPISTVDDASARRNPRGIRQTAVFALAGLGIGAAAQRRLLKKKFLRSRNAVSRRALQTPGVLKVTDALLVKSAAAPATAIPAVAKVVVAPQVVQSVAAPATATSAVAPMDAAQQAAPLPGQAELEGVFKSITAQFSSPPDLDSLTKSIVAQAQALAVSFPTNPQQLDTLTSSIVKAVVKAAPQNPAELQAALTTAQVPPEIMALIQDPTPLEPVLQPAGYGALVVALLALRRGRQYWLDELPLRYNGPWVEAYWNARPLQLLSRLSEVSWRCGLFSVNQELDKIFKREEEVMPQRAKEANELITDLGPAFVKLVQVWASRPDILPEAYQKEFEKLLEQVRPFGKEEAMETLRRNLGSDAEIERLFDDTSVFEKCIASASVGQVYKAKIKGREVAVKVQRPDVREQVTLDIYVVRALSALGSKIPIERYARQFESLFELIDRAAVPFIEELDYELEATSQIRFAKLMNNCELVNQTVAVPEVVLSKREVLVQEWLEGTKLTEDGAASDQAQKVVKILLNAYMVQFLETGFLHGDPHPGNFVLMADGKLGILDYGLMTVISEKRRIAFIEYIMHVQAKMYDECLNDLINLGFLPEGLRNDTEARNVIVPGLSNTLEILFEQSDLRVQREKFIAQREDLKSSGKLEILQAKLQEIAKKYGSFRLPGYATLIIRALATLEGVGLRSNDNFSIAAETFPYVARRLITDDSQRIRGALRAYLYKGRDRISLKSVDSLSEGFTSFTNLMRGSRDEAAKAGGAPAPTLALQHEQKESQSASTEVGLDYATKDIAAVLFSPDGNFLQELLIDEGVAAIDALSRSALLLLVRALGPLAVVITGPLSFFIGRTTESKLLTRTDKESLLLLRRIVQIIQGTSNQPSASSAGAAVDDVDPQAALRTIEDLQRLQPMAQGLLPTIQPGAQAFAQKFAQELGRRALLRIASDIEGGDSKPKRREIVSS